MILYSFIIPVYNVEKYLGECLDSVIAQSYTNWEVILVDDGSKDASPEICDEYAARNKKMKVFHEKNQGSLLARRFGALQAQGDYFIFIDSDDLINRDLLKEMTDIITKTESDVVVYRFRRFGRLVRSVSNVIFPEGTVIGENGLSKELIWEKVISGNELNNLCLKVIKKDVIDWETDYGIYKFMRFGTDFIQCMAVLDRADKIYFSEKVLYYYRYNERGISSSKNSQNTMDGLDVFFQTRAVLHEKKIYYLKKYNMYRLGFVKLLYRQYFNTDVDMLVSWMSGTADVSVRRKMIDAIIADIERNEITKGLKTGDFTGKNKHAYRLYVHDKNKFIKLIYFRAYVRRALKRMINLLIQSGLAGKIF